MKTLRIRSFSFWALLTTALLLAGCGTGAQAPVQKLGVVHLADPAYWELAGPAMERAAALNGWELVRREAPSDPAAFLDVVDAVMAEGCSRLVLCPPVFMPAQEERVKALFKKHQTVVLGGVPSVGQPIAVVGTSWVGLGRKAVSLLVNDRSKESGIVVLDAVRRDAALGVNSAINYLEQQEVPAIRAANVESLVTHCTHGVGAIIVLDPSLAEAALAAISSVQTDGLRPQIALCSRSPVAVDALANRQIDWLISLEWDRAAFAAFEVAIGTGRTRKLDDGWRRIDPIYSQPESVDVLRQMLQSPTTR